MNILITGGAGFIGSTLAKSLIEDGHEVMIIDDMSNGRIENLNNLNAVKVFQHDLTKSHDGLDILLSKTNIVFHFAASLGVENVHKNPFETFKNNALINENLFPLYKKWGVKVIFGSTSEVYGESKEEGSSEEDGFNIFSTETARGGYAAAKIYSEFYLKSFDISHTIVRFFNIVGPKQIGDRGHVLPRFIEAAVKGEDLIVYGNGQQARSFCDIRDAIEMLKILMDKKHNGETYNVGAENICTILDLAHIVKTELNSNSEIKMVKKDIDEIYNRYPKLDKINQLYKTKYTLEDIIRNIYETNFSSCTTS